MSKKTSDRTQDKKLVEGILQGDETRLRYFYEAYHARVANFIRKKIGEEADIEELAQDTLLASIDAFRDFSFRCNLYTFICAIAKRKIVDYYRKRRIKRIVFSQVPQIENLLPFLKTPEDMMEDKLVKEAIGLAFNRLSPHYRKILKLKYIDGCSVAEIATKFRISFKAAESMLFRARKAFVAVYAS